MTKPEAFAQYRECLQQILFVPIEVTQQDWVNVISSKLLLLAATFHDAEGAAIHRDGHRYLAWEPAPRAIEVGESEGSLVNTYRYQNGADGVDIRMSSIHSGKGQNSRCDADLGDFPEHPLHPEAHAVA
ncbi:hypothetical protein N8H41_13725 [Pseudomonas vlassakiae]|uniref:hypothetical protein n=1 Tax=Pseudomonas vlassakiae TaxID=485888 RepID=UPI0021CA326B|nr:hypothetical protein [Pseudomonas vlassakiae]MCU0125030.1 hypothetical protein [Pseudomonas vlassakiae]